MKNNLIFVEFSTPEEEIAYLRNKVAYLEKHAMELADFRSFEKTHYQHAQLQELLDIKNSRSWKITRPLREVGRYCRYSFLIRLKKWR